MTTSKRQLISKHAARLSASKGFRKQTIVPWQSEGGGRTEVGRIINSIPLLSLYVTVVIILYPRRLITPVLTAPVVCTSKHLPHLLATPRKSGEESSGQVVGVGFLRQVLLHWPCLGLGREFGAGFRGRLLAQDELSKLRSYSVPRSREAFSQ